MFAPTFRAAATFTEDTGEDERSVHELNLSVFVDTFLGKNLAAAARSVTHTPGAEHERSRLKRASCSLLRSNTQSKVHSQLGG